MLGMITAVALAVSSQVTDVTVYNDRAQVDGAGDAMVPGGRTVRHSCEYLLTVKNTHDIAEEVIVWDPLPISGTEGLKVKLVEPKDMNVEGL